MSSFSVVAIVERGKAETALHHQLRGDGGSTTDMAGNMLTLHYRASLVSLDANHAVCSCR